MRGERVLKQWNNEKSRRETGGFFRKKGEKREKKKELYENGTLPRNMPRPNPGRKEREKKEEARGTSPPCCIVF